MEESDTHLGAIMTKIVNAAGNVCWAMSADDYYTASVANVEKVLSDKGLRIPTKFLTPMNSGYRPELDATTKLRKIEPGGIRNSLQC